MGKYTSTATYFRSGAHDDHSTNLNAHTSIARITKAIAGDDLTKRANVKVCGQIIGLSTSTTAL